MNTPSPENLSPAAANSEAPTLAPAALPQQASELPVTAEALTVAPPSGTATAEGPALPVVPGYTILSVLGRGGMGVVYKAEQTALHRLVALKMILHGDHVSADERRRFQAEAEAIARLQHANIVQVHEVGEHNGLPYFSLEFCSGGSLEKQLDGTPWEPQRAATLVQTLSQAVQAAHQAALVHRDLKPGNVLLTADGTPKVTDFGLVKQVGVQGQTQSGAVVGTPSYMAPEQAGGKGKEVGPAADVYALGAILYELLTGRPPFKALTALETVIQVVSDDPVPVRQLQPKTPQDLETICHKCLEKDPQRRYPTAAALGADLRAYLAEEPISARPVGRLERAWKWARRNKAVAVAVATVAAVLIAGSIISTYFGFMADREARIAHNEADRARQQEEIADTNRRAAEASEREQKRLSVGVLLGNARNEVKADNPAAALPFLTLANQIAPDPNRDGQIAGLLAAMPRLVLFGRHREAINHLAVSPDGTRLVSGSNDRTVRLWNVERGTPVGPPISFPSPVAAVAFSPDGAEFAVAGGVGESSRVARFATADGRPLADLPHLPNTPTYVAYTPDGQLITGEASFGIRLKEIGSDQVGKPVATYRLHDLGQAKLPPGYEIHVFESNVQTLARLAAASRGWVLSETAKTTRLIDLRTGRPVGSFAFAEGPRGAEIAASGRHAVLIGADEIAHVWDLDRGSTHPVPLGHPWVRATAVDERGQLAVAFDDGFVQRYTLADGRPVPESAGAVGEVGWEPRFSPDGAYLAAVRGDVARVWRTDDREPLCPPLRHGAAVTTFQVSALGRRLAVGAADGTVRVWDLATDQRPAFQAKTNFPAGNAANIDLRFLADGRFVLAGGGALWTESPDRLDGHRDIEHKATLDPAVFLTVVTPDGKRVFSAQGSEVRVSGDGLPAGGEALKHSFAELHIIVPSPDGRYVATMAALFGHQAWVWEVATGKRLHSQLGHNLAEPFIVALAVHSESGRVAMARLGPDTGRGNRTRVRVYDLASGRQIGQPLVSSPQMKGQRLQFSPDGRLLALTSGLQWGIGGELVAWDVETGRAVVPPMRLNKSTYAWEFSPDGRWLAVAAGNRVLLFDPTTDHPPTELPHPGMVQFARFNRSGSTLVTAAGNAVFLWDPATRNQIHPPLRHGYWVVSAAVSPDGRYVVAIGSNGELKGWQITGRQLRPETAARLSRLLSCTALSRDEMVPARAEQMEEDWSTLRRTDAGEVVPAAEAVADWHAAQSETAWNVRRFGVAGQQLEAAGTWPRYATDWCRFQTGACYLRVGDRAGVRRIFLELARIADADPTPLHFVWAVEIGLHDPEALGAAERTRAIAIGDKLPGREAERVWYVVLARALALTRAGRLEAAERELAELQKGTPKIVQARADAELAVIRRLQGRAAEAKKLADAAAEELSRLESGGLTEEWISAIFLRLLVDEARRPVSGTR
jgi:WD40 repeat protein